MKEIYQIAGLILFFLSVIYFKSCIPDTVPMNSMFPGSVANNFCADPSGDSTALCSYIPRDVDTIFGVGYNGGLTDNTQPVFDVLAWQSFIALNWPADTEGKPLNTSIGSDPSAPRVWESWAAPYEVFNEGQPSDVCPITETSRPILEFSKITTAIDQSGGFLEFDKLPLIDKNLNFTLYEILMNGEEEDYINKHHLNTAAGQDSFTVSDPNRIQLPAGKINTEFVGAMETKLSWRILTSRDDASRFFTRKANISIPAENSASGQAFCIENATVGLVGMHIIHKTSTIPNFIWATFEHIDNVPENLDEAATDTDPNSKWSYYNPNCQDCPVNNPPGSQQDTFIWETTEPYARRYGQPNPSSINTKAIYGTQMVRQYQIYRTTQKMNSNWQEKLAGTVWANYMLVGTQWRHPNNPIAPDPIDAPTYLGNATMESYILGTSSCTNCHQSAQTASGKASADFSFLFGHAK